MKVWFCIGCRKAIDTGGSVPDILTKLIKTKLSPRGVPLCPDCGNECVQVEDEEPPNEP